MLQEYRTSFRAMGTNVTVMAVGKVGSKAIPALLGRVQGLFQREEARFSRFLPHSELTRMNQAGGSPDPSQEMWEVLQRCRRWWVKTGGDFDPTILEALERAGYHRSFETLGQGGFKDATPGTRGPSGLNLVELREVGGQRTVRLHQGVRLDLGGIVKGWTVDRAASLLEPLGRFLIDAGGDIFARGDSLETPGWCVAVQDPRETHRDREYLFLKDAAVATSGTYRRRWLHRDGGEAHHLIDPRTGAPSRSLVVSATVTGGSAEVCDVCAKVALLRGPEAALAFLQGLPDVEGYLVLQDGRDLATAGWPGWRPQAAFLQHREAGA